MPAIDQNIPASTDGREKLLLFWRSLGPYHVARARAVAEMFKNRGVRTVAVELCKTEETRHWQIDRSQLPIEVRTVDPHARLSEKLPNRVHRLVHLLEEMKPCCLAVAGYDRPEMRASLRWANRNGAVAILMSETKWDDRPRGWWKRLFAARQVRRADAALVSGAAAGEYLVSLGMRRELIFRQYGTVDNAFFTNHATRLRKRDDGSANNRRRYFLACGRFIEVRKNLVRLLFAYEQYRGRAGQQAWELVLCGDGPDRKALEKLAGQRSLQGVTFAGFQQAEQLAAYYAKASCFVHPAMNEAWGLVVNEAMAAGLPVLVSRRCGCAYDLVEEGVNGWCFNPYDIEELADLMTRMTTMGTLGLAKMGISSQRTIRKWGPDRFAEGLARAIDTVRRIGKNRSGQPDVELPELQMAHNHVAYDGPTYSAPCSVDTLGRSSATDCDRKIS